MSSTTLPHHTNRRGLRIVVSGPTGSGKTTLARALAARLGLPVIEEDMQSIFSAHRALKEARARGNANDATRAKAQWIQSFGRWADRRMELYRAHPGFVADRWEADLLDLWLIQFAAEGMDDGTVKLLRNMQFKSRLLHYAVVLPFGDMMGGATNGADGDLRRVSAFSMRLLNSIVTKGLIQQCTTLPVIEVPEGDSSVDDRIALIEARILDRHCAALSR